MKLVSLYSLLPHEMSYKHGEDMPIDRKKLTQVVNDYTYHTKPNCVVHVENGKPLTAIGARLMGVPWRG